MNFKTVKDFSTFCDEARNDIEGQKLDVEKLDRFFAVAEVVKESFGSEVLIEVETPSKNRSVTNIIVKGQDSDFNKGQLETLSTVLRNIDGLSISGTEKKDKIRNGFMLIFSIENIWEE